MDKCPECISWHCLHVLFKTVGVLLNRTTVYVTHGLWQCKFLETEYNVPECDKSSLWLFYEILSGIHVKVAITKVFCVWVGEGGGGWDCFFENNVYRFSFQISLLCYFVDFILGMIVWKGISCKPVTAIMECKIFVLGGFKSMRGNLGWISSQTKTKRNTKLQITNNAYIGYI